MRKGRFHKGCYTQSRQSLISVHIVHAMNKGKSYGTHKLSAILMAFMLTTPAAFCCPEATNGTEATTVLLAPQRPLPAQTRLLLTTGGVAAGAVGTATVVGGGNGCWCGDVGSCCSKMTVAMAVLITPQPPRPLHANTALTRRN